MARTVLLTDASSYKAAVIARFLKTHYPSVRIVTCDHRAYTRHLRTRYSDAHEVLDSGPEADREAYTASLERVIAAHRPDVLIPINSREQGVFLAARERLGPAVAYLGPLELYAGLHDKARFQAMLAEAGLPGPRTFADLNETVPPAVMKPVAASSSSGVVYLMDQAAIRRAIGRYGAAPQGMLIQEFVEGEGVGLSGFFQDGKRVVSYLHRRLGELPSTGGSSVFRETYPYSDGAEIERLIDAVLARLPWSGFAMFEFKRTREGRLVFLECNPRIWGSVHQGLASGANYFAPLLGPPERPLRATENVRTFLNPLVYAAMLQYLLRGRLRPVLRFLRLWQRSRADIPLTRDPAAWLALVLRAL